MIFSDPGLIKQFGTGIENYAMMAGIVAAVGVMLYGEVMKRQKKKTKQA
jgi:hypothetical protein